MKSIPSLVASSTVGVATTGLAFGRPQVSTPTRPTSHKRKATEYDMENRAVSPPRSRPATSSTDATPERDAARNSSPLAASSPAGSKLLSDSASPSEDTASNIAHLNSTERRREASLAQDHVAVRRRSSVSSRPNSWIIRRLSLIQISSHQGSPRSSVGLESPSLSLSHGSAAAILDPSGNPAPLPPNKLVKRSTSGRLRDGDAQDRSGSRSQMLTLRRPATSYQRSVTLQQQMKQEEMASAKLSPRQPGSSPASQRRVVSGTHPPADDATVWRPYFESRPTKLTKERPSARPSESSMDAIYPSSRRVIMPEGSRAPFLLKASKIKKITSWMDKFAPVEPETEDTVNAADSESSPMDSSLHEEPHKRARRSLSMQFSSPSRWVQRTGSLRAPKRSMNTGSIGRRHASAPIESPIGQNTLSTYGANVSSRKGITDSSVYQVHSHGSSDDHEALTRMTRSALPPRARVNSSPPPRSRLSSLSMDIPRRGTSSSSSSAPRRSLTPLKSSNISTTPSPPSVSDRSRILSSSKVVIHQVRPPRVPEVSGSDRASTLVGSDTDVRGFVSGDDDELDFQSDTVFDSYRTGTTGSLRSRNAPLELMFDESPPDKSHSLKTGIIREIAANGMLRESSDRIVEEDEGMSTPIKHRRGSDRDAFDTPTRATTNAPDDAIRSSPPSFAEASKELARLSLEDEDEDEDWTKDDDLLTIGSPLSPPSSNSRRANTTIRPALTDVTKTGTSSANASRDEYRPRSLFDWSEPLNPDKTDGMGNSPRPKTVHGKQAVDSRGGRTVGRRGPSALHIRSQSVPVIPDAAGHREHRKLAPKFGTWGLGGKGVNEDWDNDFEFDGVDDGEADNGTESMSGSAMLVPPAIQASQANVVGHVGQIREFCLLVEDLKRLRGLARERGILDGPSAGLWRDAEGIIALAIPDEEDEILSPPRSPSLFTTEHDVIDDKYQDVGFDTDDMSETRVDGEAPAEQGQSNGLGDDNGHVHRQSVFSPEDDIFGMGGVPTFHQAGEEKYRTIKASHQSSTKGSTEVARSVMENIHQHRATSDPLHTHVGDLKKMPFDTTSLRDLVHRANALSRILAEIIRKADGSIRSPSPDTQTERDSSPAFTRLFSDPPSSPPRHLLRSQSNNSILSGSIDASPTRGLGNRMHIMTVV